MAKWTFMVYLAGDNNLSAAGDTDLAEMQQVGSSGEVNLIAQFDNAGSSGTRRFRIVQPAAESQGREIEPPERPRPPIGEVLEDLGETDSGDPQVLLDFVRWAAKNYPAERYALVLWNHGGGWEPAEIDRIAREVGAKNYSGREVGERSASRLGRAFFRTTWETIFKVESPAERAILSDDGTGHSLDTVELGQVLAEVQAILGQKLDLLGMDACLMSNIEVAYQARPHVNYVVASEETEPNNGWPYTPILSRLLQTPDLPTRELAAHIAQTYVASYTRGETVTQTALDLSRMDSLIEPINRFAGALKAELPAQTPTLWTAQRRTAKFWDGTLWDLGQLCQQIQAKLGDSGAIAQAAQSVIEALQAGPNQLVLSAHKQGDALKDCCGVSIYLPVPGMSDISKYYAELEFAKDTAWVGMLQAYHA